MVDRDPITEQFETHRGHLRSVAYRMLGSWAEADDAVQEAWLRLNRTDTSDVENLAGWLTTVVARISLDMLRTRSSRREETIDASLPEAAEPAGHGTSPEQQVEMADEVGPALQVVLDTLAPAERLAFALHDLFGVPFDEIAVILDRSTVSARQLASRARRKVRVGEPVKDEVDLERQREVVSAFLQASRAGDFEALLVVLDPDVVVRADAVAVKMGMEPEIHGATAVLNTFLGKAIGATFVTINGVTGLAWFPGGKLRAAIRFTVEGDRVTAINLVATPDSLDDLAIVQLPFEDGPDDQSPSAGESRNSESGR